VLTGGVGRETRAMALFGGGQASPSAQSFSTVSTGRLFKMDSGSLGLGLVIILIALAIGAYGYQGILPQMAGKTPQLESEARVTFVAASPPPVPVPAVSVPAVATAARSQPSVPPGQGQKSSPCPGEVRGGFCVLN
jgi:hypothetical protein